MTKGRLGWAVMLLALATPMNGHAADNEPMLSGTVKSIAGEPMGGATVSAKAAGATITTSVFSDAKGHYSFPALPPGSYRLWAQARGYEAARAQADLSQSRRQDFVLRRAGDAEVVRRLTGNQLLVMTFRSEQELADAREKACAK